jgi:hypothetical protein
MHLRKPFAIMTMGVTMVHAKCYGLTPGIYGQTFQGAAEKVEDFCDHYLAGFFTEGQTKYQCLDLQQNVKAEFWVTWMGSGDLPLNSQDCKIRLKNEINKCTAGGESVVADWYFR